MWTGWGEAYSVWVGEGRGVWVHIWFGIRDEVKRRPTPNTVCLIQKYNGCDLGLVFTPSKVFFYRKVPQTF